MHTFSLSATTLSIMIIYTTLYKDPTKRPSARALLQHPFVTHNRRTLKSTWTRTIANRSRRGVVSDSHTRIDAVVQRILKVRVRVGEGGVGFVFVCVLYECRMYCVNMVQFTYMVSHVLYIHGIARTLHTWCSVYIQGAHRCTQMCMIYT